MNEIIVRILKNKIKRDKDSNSLNVEDTITRLKIFLAGGDITTEQYGEFEEMLVPTTSDTNSNTQTTAS
ncbi:MAG: hypothetical protein LKH93_06965 [Clostridium beijerinckii]|jgi:hypothetical protein|nr:hypothetical protein [Clostridium beijerinckii]MCI1578569.1 hypothetical protein [Clostridium beijerinckii]MCI1582099.1 hypothetical protein [Clostridium beijerinckii]MCI1621949.1 hypothetical protein [Clostridium beijerinckii]